MNLPWITQHLWLAPLLPLLAAAATSRLPRRAGLTAGVVALAALGGSFLLSLCALAAAIRHGRGFVNLAWFDLGAGSFRIGWVLDPLAALMLVMVSFVGSCIFLYSIGYMAGDPRRRQFFCFLSLFAAAMLGLVVANHLLVIFMCWELVGLASYLLIGFWFDRDPAADAARKAFLTTRVGDIGFLLGILWLGREAGTLLLFDAGAGCLEAGALGRLGAAGIVGGLAVTTWIGLLVFCGAVGKSGQFPLHTWLPDAMEGPTPVSALIHAATMVAAGVFLVARLFPLMEAAPGVLTVVAAVGAFTALFAALVGIAQNDIKRILAYSTVSQLGYMMLALGVGGWPAAVFHLLTHACFKALLFLGSGSVIHGCHGEQDIRRMGGLRAPMKLTFATYAVGMMALAGFPLLFSGFWSKEAILHAAQVWNVSRLPFYAGIAGTALTAFYMTRLMAHVFWGSYRGDAGHPAHESPPVMTVPLVALAVLALGAGFLGTPAWPWLEAFLTGTAAHGGVGELAPGAGLMVLSTLVVAAGVSAGWWLYGRRPRQTAAEPDPLARSLPGLWRHLSNRLWIDELHAATVLRATRLAAAAADWADRFVWGGIVWLAVQATVGCAWLSRLGDEFGFNRGFDGGCESLRRSGGRLSAAHSGRITLYLRALAVGFALLLLATFLLMSRATHTP